MALTIEEYHVFLQGDTNEYVFANPSALQQWITQQTVIGYIEKHITTKTQHDIFNFNPTIKETANAATPPTFTVTPKTVQVVTLNPASAPVSTAGPAQ